jgi:predicted pyridoxine 5'-phosphate oxidase superfamily flavin-nucleotide-binding protein
MRPIILGEVNMSSAFAKIAFTPGVAHAQSVRGTREANHRLEEADLEDDSLSEREVGFIEARDSFYQATVSETGWPYLQHRGGPVGFLKVLDPKTIAFADYRGNRQYVSVGNLLANDRIVIFLMDYPNQRRLKVWGHARIVEAAADPALMARLAEEGYKAPIERAFVISVEAFSWNCPKHITRRFSEAEVRSAIEPLLEELEELRARIAAAEAERVP